MTWKITSFRRWGAPAPGRHLTHRGLLLPELLSAIVLRMMAKRPEERFQNMAGVIEALEGYLGEGKAAFAPREQHANLLERCVEEFNASRWGRWRRWLVLLLTALSAVATGLAEWRLGPPWGMAVGAFTAVAWVASFSIRGLFEKGALFLRCRQLVFQAPLVTWLVWLLLLGGAGYGLYRFQLLFPAVILMAAAILFALAFYISWRDPLIRWMDFLQDARRRRREKRQLRMLERKKAKAQEEFEAGQQDEDSSQPE